MSLLFGWILPRVPSVWVKINHIYQSKKLHTSEATYMYISRRSSINQKLHTSDIEAPYIRSYIHVHQPKKLHTSEATYIRHRSYIHQKLHTSEATYIRSYIHVDQSKKFHTSDIETPKKETRVDSSLWFLLCWRHISYNWPYLSLLLYKTVKYLSPSKIQKKKKKKELRNPTSHEKALF